MNNIVNILVITLVAWFLLVPLPSAAVDGQVGRFNPQKDLFLPQFDSKTDVDDLHSVAGVATMLASPALHGVRFHAVAGAYGTQGGLYVPSPELFDLAFGAHWSDAHGDWEAAGERVAALASSVLAEGGQVWVAEAGQSDFTAHWGKALVKAGYDGRRIHVVQHSDWNESVTSPEALAWVKDNLSYHRIADGNASRNGTPNFTTADGSAWLLAVDHEAAGEIWAKARGIADQYNGIEARYLNESIAAGGLDFSDVVESCWIFGFEELADVNAFFAEF